MSKFTYKNVSQVTISDEKKLATFLKNESNRFKQRIADRNLPLDSIKKVTKLHQKQFTPEGVLKSDAVKYHLTFADGTKNILNFSNPVKKS